MIVLRGKKVIVFAVALSLILGIGASYYLEGSSQSAEIIVGFKFAGIERHENPDGSKFDPYQIVSPYILNEVIEELDLERLTPNDIRNLIVMSPIIPNDTIAIKEYNIEQEGEAYTYYPDEYIMTLNTSRELEVDGNLAQTIAYEIVRSYITYFQDSYIKRKSVENYLGVFDPEEYDYADVASIFKRQASEHIGFTGTMASIDEDYRSIHTGMSFNDLLESVSLINEVDLNRMNAIISSYKITKDEDRLIVYYEYLIKQLEFQKEQFGDEATVNKDMLLNIEDTSNILVASVTGNSTDATQGYFNQLILAAYETESDALGIQEQIDYYKDEIDDLIMGRN